MDLRRLRGNASKKDKSKKERNRLHLAIAMEKLVKFMTSPPQRNDLKRKWRQSKTLKISNKSE